MGQATDSVRDLASTRSSSKILIPHFMRVFTDDKSRLMFDDDGDVVKIVVNDHEREKYPQLRDAYCVALWFPNGRLAGFFISGFEGAEEE